MQEIHKLRGQITNLVQTNFPGVNVYLDPKMKPPSSLQVFVKIFIYLFICHLLNC